MAVKLGQVRAAEDVRDFFIRKPVMKRVMRYSARFLAGMGVGAARLFSGCAPFGIALVSAAGTELEGLLCLMGTLAGYLLCGGLVGSVRYIAAMFLVFTVELLFRDVRITRSVWFMPSITMLFTLASGIFYPAGDNGLVPRALRIFVESILAGAGCFLFREVVPSEIITSKDRKKILCLFLTIACVLMSLTPLGIRKVLYLGPVLSLLIVMLTAYGGGSVLGCAVGAVLGLAMDAAGDAVIVRTACYAVSALAAGAVHKKGRLLFVLVYCASNAMCILLGWNGRLEISALYECFAASVIFMILPAGFVNVVGAWLHPEAGNSENAFRRYQAARMQRISEAFHKLYEIVEITASSEAATLDLDALYDRSADAVCQSCENKELCWHEDSAQTLSVLNQASEAFQARGAMRTEDLTDAFKERCTKTPEFVAAVNAELRGLLYRRQFLSRLSEVKTAACGQFSDVSSIMHSVACDFAGGGGADAETQRKLQRFVKGMEMDGDVSVFRDVRGRLHIVIESPDAESFMQTENWLEKLSEIVGTRLSRIAEGESERILLIQAEPLAVSVGIAAVKKDGESISGDRSSYFKTDAGYLCVILSDGMGTGPMAAVESSAAVKILEEFLRSGVEPESAMRLLNAVVMLKNGENWGYATVDLCCIDLFTGQTSFYKYGAAPSYIKTGRAIRRIKGKSMAAGMTSGEGSVPDVITMRLKPGHVALIASDGVLAEDNDQWLRDVLAQSDGQDMKTLSRLALQAARDRFGNSDDMTCMAIRVEERP